MTVGELKRLLATVPDNTLVLTPVGDTYHSYYESHAGTAEVILNHKINRYVEWYGGLSGDASRKASVTAVILS